MDGYEGITTVIKKIRAGFDIGTTIFQGAHDKGIFINYEYKDLRILAPKYFIEIIKNDTARRLNMPSFDPEGYFIWVVQGGGIKMVPSPFNKVILYHEDYPLYQHDDMYHEFDLSILID